VILIVLTLLNPNMTNELPHHPPMLLKGGWNLKTTFVIRRVIYWFIITTYVHYQITNNVSIYGILIIKNKLNSHFVFLCLLYSPVGDSIIRLDFTLHLFSIREISLWNLSPHSSQTAPMSSGKNSKWECRKLSFNEMLHPTALYYETISCTISL
jgi:hypothetical protein